MSDHSKPRRWTLRIVGNTVAMRRGRLNAAVNGPELFNVPAVPVREDCITTEDVDGTAELLEQLLPMPRSTQTREARLVECQEYARILLGRIFEGRE